MGCRCASLGGGEGVVSYLGRWGGGDGILCVGFYCDGDFVSWGQMFGMILQHNSIHSEAQATTDFV